jgi:hypothetical protein
VGDLTDREDALGESLLDDEQIPFELRELLETMAIKIAVHLVGTADDVSDIRRRLDVLEQAQGYAARALELARTERDDMTRAAVALAREKLIAECRFLPRFVEANR